MLRKGLKWAAIVLGALLVWLTVLFIAAAVAADRVPINLRPGLLVTSLGDSYVMASGTWVIEGQQQAFPLQTTEIRCEKEIGRCTSGTATVMFGKQLHVDVSFHEIVSWAQGRVVFVDDTPSCVQYVYTIDLSSKAVNGVRKKRPAAGNSTQDCSSLESELRLSLKSGFDQSFALQKAAMPWFGELALLPMRIFQ